jgi:hypothetical protein
MKLNYNELEKFYIDSSEFNFIKDIMKNASNKLKFILLLILMNSSMNTVREIFRKKGQQKY